MTYQEKSNIVSVSISILLVISFFLYQHSSLQKGILKEMIETCSIEDTLSFEGIITDYSGYGMKSSPIYLLIDGKPISIPRYNYQFRLYTGDSIKKNKHSNTYFIKHNNRLGNRCDTVIFKCSQ